MSGTKREDCAQTGWNRGERIVASLATLYAEGGGEIGAILGVAGITGSADEFLRGGLSRTPQEKLHALRSLLTVALAKLAAEATGREMIRPPDWQMLFFCLANCRSLREAIDRGSDFLTVLNGRCGRMQLHAGAADAEVRIDSLWPRRSIHTFAVDTLGIAIFLDIFAWLIAQPIPVSAVLLDYPSEMLERFDTGLLPEPITMNAGRSGLIFPSRYLDYPVVRSTDDCEAGMETILSSLFDLRSQGVKVRSAERARHMMLRALRDHGAVPSLEEVGRQLGCSRDQLRRWLAAEGISYNDIKESCRRELALDLLRRSHLPIEEISARLGYWDSDAFRQAVRKWTGLSPTEFRKAG